MRGAVIRIAAALLAVLLCFPGLIIAARASGGEERECETVADLLAELEKDLGGVISLVGDGQFVLEENVYIEVLRPVTVNLPPSGIEIGNRFFSVTFSGPITFAGTRGFTLTGYAVLELYDGVSIEMREGQSGKAPVAVSLDGPGKIWADSSVVLHAEGEGAVALNAAEECNLDLGYARVSAAGDGAAAIVCDGYLRLYKASVEAIGDGSLAIYGADDVELCQVEVSGAIEAGTVYSVLSGLSYLPPRLVELEARPDAPLQQTVVYQDLICGSPPVDLPDRIDVDYYYKLPGDWFELQITVSFGAVWDLGGLDYAVPGDYTATASLKPVMPISGLEAPVITHEVIVVAQDRAALYADWGIGDYAAAMCLAPIRDADEILFWVHEGENGWRELTASGNAVYADEWGPALHPDFDCLQYPLFQVSGLEKDALYWVMAQVVGGPMEGFSNLWQMYTGADLGGDRTGTDRYYPRPVTMPPGQNTMPEPPPEPPKDEAPKKGNGGSTGKTSTGKATADRDIPAPQAPVAETDAEIQEPAMPALDAPAQVEPVAHGVSAAVQVVESAASDADSAPPLPEEWEDENTSAITGKRLLALLESDGPITFIKHGARVVVDRDALLALQIEEHSLFTVTVLPLGDTYTVRFELDGAEIDPPYTLLFPEAPANAAPASEIHSAASAPDILSAPAGEAEEPDPIPLVPIGIICGSLMSGGYWLVRKRLFRR